MGKVSVLIPSRNEQFLAPTVDDLFAKAEGEIEVLVFLDGYKPDPPLQERDNLILIHSRKPLGMRHAINACASVASGTYLMKCDAHCMFDEGFDYWLSDDAHITQAADLTINPGFTPAGFWVSVDSLDVKIRMYPASADTTFASPTDWFPLDDGEGMTFPLQVDYITIKVIGTDLGRVRYAFWGHSTP